MDPLHPAFPEAVTASELVIVHMLGHREVEAAIRIRRSRGLRTIFEIGDNFLDLGGWLPRRHLLRSPLVRQNILFHASLCDAVQIYAAGLHDLAARVNPNVIVLDPYVPLAAQRPARSDSFVIGWGGTTSHEDDLARIAPVIVELCRRHADAVFAFMGSKDLFSRYFGAIPTGQRRAQPFGDYDRYLEFVRSLDVGLAPLGESGFNAGRTDTKFATYAACGVAAVIEAAPVHLPHRERAMLFRSPAELAECLESLHADRARIADLAQRAYEWAARERSADRLREQRERCYESLLPSATAEDRPSLRSEPPSSLPTGTGAVDEAARLAKCVGLQPEEALAGAREILAEHPRYAAAAWLALRSLEALGRLQEAVDLIEGFAFPAIYADVAAEMQTRLARKLRPEDVASHMARIASPLARLRLQHRDQKDMGAFYRAVLEEQPFDFFALSTVIRLLSQRDESSPELDALYERICLIAPETVPFERRPASLARYLPAVRA
jgi:hypothetical protein